MSDHELVDRLRRVSLVEIADQLGLPIVRRGNGGTTSCLFHRDRKPSMSLYQSKSGDWLFKCFSCKAHGDAFDLVQKVENCDFRTALEKIASIAGETLPRRNRKAEPTISGVQVAQRLYGNQNADEKRKLKEWAQERSFKFVTLSSYSITCAANQKLSTAVSDREEIAALRDASLIYLPSFATARQPALDMELNNRDAMIGERIIFPVADWNGTTQGFMGRATQDDVQPRYQFTRGFPKSQLLFGLDFARKSLQAKSSTKETTERQTEGSLYVVEGATDVLRLRELGMNAVAVLGSDLSSDQAKLIERLARELAEDAISLTVRLFFDGDDAGLSATRHALTKLLLAQAEQALFGVEVVAPLNDEHPYRTRDPDIWLSKATKRNAQKTVNEAVVSTGCFLMAYGLRCNIDEVDSRWNKSAMTQRYAAMRRVDNLLPKREWKSIFETLSDDLFATTVSDNGEAMEPGNWPIRLTDYLCRSGSGLASSDDDTSGRFDRESTKIIHAIQIAHNASQRREFPVDSGSWDRLLVASNVTTPYFMQLLNQGADACNIEPLLGMYVPKQKGDVRLKAIPCAEQLSIQQYLLNELLGGSLQSPDFDNRIPAVRFDGGSLRTTGWLKSDVEQVLCFSYQIDMEVVRGEKPPGNEGIFRPYTECWFDFVDHLSRKVQSSESEQFDDRPFHVARLDVRAYYDTVSRASLDRILFDPLLEAIKSLEEPNSFATSFRPSVNDVTQRTREFIDLLCAQSFGYSYVDPSTGIEKRYKDGASVGMPQGPSLSAYIGSISLFKLDEAVQSSIEKNNSDAAYARYVDDMVLITRSKSDLDRLRATIQRELGLIGLELSPKVEPLPPMNAVQVQHWLTANRGLANISGVNQAPPIVGQPIGDDGCLDRRSALVRLHDPELLNPSTSDSTVRDVIYGVLNCPEVRFSDKCHTAELVWRLIAVQISQGDIGATNAEQIADRYEEIWNASSEESSASLGEAKWVALTAVHGLDRSLSRRSFKSQLFDDQQQQESYAWRQAIATAVLSGVVERLVLKLPVDDFSLKHVLAVHELNLYYRALSVTEPTDVSDMLNRIKQIASEFPRSTTVTRHVISIASLRNGVMASDSLASVAHGQADIHILFHQAISRLSCSREDEAADPMLKMVDVVRDAFSRNTSEVLARTLVSWLPDEEMQLEKGEAIRSLSVFLNIVDRDRAKLLNQRKTLVTEALRYTSENQAMWLPCLPIERIDGFVGYSENDFLAVRTNCLSSLNIEDTGADAIELSPKLAWREVQSGSDPSFWRTPASPFNLLTSDEIASLADRHDLPTWIADSFENLVNLSSDGIECPPTIHNLLVEGTINAPDRASVPIAKVLGFSVPSYHFDAQSFVRSSNQGLVPKAVFANGARYWRAGIAITDAVGLMDEVFYDPLKSVVRPSYSPQLSENDADHRWAMEKLVRFSLQRLCGRTSNSSFVRETPGIPKSLQRVLQRLRSFPIADSGGDSHLKLAAVLAAVFETRFAAARFDDERNQEWEHKSGAAASMLAQIARRAVYSEKQLAIRLPRVKTDRTGKRRNISAWISLAARIHELNQLISDETEALRTPLLAICNGLGFTGLSDLLRCLALETIAADTNLREQIASLNPSSVLLAEWQLDGFELLTHDQSDRRVDGHERTELESLLTNLNRGLANDNRSQSRNLERITPIGWAVVVGIVTGVLRSDLRLSFLSLNEPEQAFTLLFTQVCDLLKPPAREPAADENEVDDPWSGLARLLDGAIFDRVLECVQRLDAFGEAMGLQVSPLKSSRRFRMEPTEYGADSMGTQRRTWEVSLNEETYEIEPWRIATAATANEQRSARAENVREDDSDTDSRRVYFWTETRFNDELISVHVAKPGIADLAGFHGPAEIAFSTQEKELVHQDGTAKRTDDGEKGIDPNHDDKNKSSQSETPKSVANIETRENLSPTLPDIDWRDLTAFQNQSWNTRGDRGGSHYKRIALVQWQVEEFGSYRHPIYECDEDSLASQSPNGEIGKHTETIDVKSYVEHRRRRLLDEVLRACKAFNVDLLLLPEYSTRPETVEWLLSRLYVQNIELTVWAGTFRFPPFYRKLPNAWTTQPPDWSSVLPIITTRTDTSGAVTREVRTRLKKYPSIAYGEQFNPNSDTLTATTDEWTQVTELICSEIFLASSPTNLIGLWKTWDDLGQQFGGPPKGEAQAINHVLGDIRSFATETTMCNPTGWRRSILFVPAMTPRTVDYAVLGQANYLAAGLTTVFCNDSGRHSHGQSCFIGQNGWDVEGGQSVGLPGPTPYHGVSPGIYRPFQKGRGWLDQNEQAMVIADIDPLYQAEGKPRPQNLMPPLKLVAHLPILEVGQFAIAKSGLYGNMAKLRQPEAQQLLGLKWPDNEFWPSQSIANISCRRCVLSNLLTLISEHLSTYRVSPNTIHDKTKSKLADLLKALAFASPENSGWLKQRAAAFAQEHAANPMPYPPPVALDWLYVDLNEGNTKFSKIQVPPLSF